VKNRLVLSLILCLSLGLAPFSPEPHVWQKIKWLVDGGNGMQAIDYFDLVLHGSPWLFLVYTIIGSLRDKSHKTES
jgi:hypothetical protein